MAVFRKRMAGEQYGGKDDFREAEGSGMKKQTITALFSCDIKTV